MSIKSEIARSSLKTTSMEFLREPTEKSKYLIKKDSSHIIFGNEPNDFEKTGCDLYVCLTEKPLPEIVCRICEVLQFHVKAGRCSFDKETFEFANRLYNEFQNRNIYIFCSSDRINVLAVCLLSIHHRISPEEALRRWLLISPYNIPDKFQSRQIQRFKRPLRVIVCGDRDGTITFDEVIRLAFRDIPNHSTIIDGGCKGIDRMANRIARELGFKTETYPISDMDWKTYKTYAGPRRNRIMLETGVDLILAFHPDISYSKGTKDMLDQGVRKGVKCYIHDLKSKKEYFL